MVSIFRAHGMRFVIFTNDHAPAHVHVFGDGEAKVNLVGANGEPELVYATGMNFRDANLAMSTIRQQQAQMIARWKEIHG